MSWFNNLRTMTKIALGYAVITAMLIAVVWLGDRTGAGANAATRAVYERDLTGLSLTLQSSVLQWKIARTIRQGMLQKSAADKDASLKEIDRYATELDAELVDLERSLLLDINKQRAAQVRSHMSEFIVHGRQSIDDSRTDPDKAMKTLALTKEIGLKADAGLNEIAKAKFTLAKQEYDRSLTDYEQSRRFSLMALLVAVAVGIGFSVTVGRSVARPLASTVEVLDRVADGDLSAELDVSRHDEIGQMATALNKALGAMRGTLEDVQSVSAEVSSAAQQLASAAESISSGAQEQASSLEETASSLEEVGSTVKQNSDNAQHAAQLASSARDAAEHGGRVVEGAVAAMGEIINSSKRIADIITTIDEIAFQTNLLALNAAVEAARAGEQGRGFGVVAAEVRNLAQRTATAAKEIRSLIVDSSAKVETGTQQVNRSGATLDEIVTSVKRVTDMVSEIASASREQNSAISQVNVAVSQVDQVTQANASHTEELSATAESLASKADQLQSLVNAFRLSDRESAAPAPEPVVRSPARRRPPALPQQPKRSNGHAGTGMFGRTPSLVPPVDGGFQEF